jgi:hypothetical protein
VTFTVTRTKPTVSPPSRSVQDSLKRHRIPAWPPCNLQVKCARKNTIPMQDCLIAMTSDWKAGCTQLSHSLQTTIPPHSIEGVKKTIVRKCDRLTGDYQHSITVPMPQCVDPIIDYQTLLAQSPQQPKRPNPGPHHLP